MNQGFAGINSIQERRHFFPIDTIGCAVDLDGQATPSGEIFAILRHGNKNVHELDKILKHGRITDLISHTMTERERG